MAKSTFNSNEKLIEKRCGKCNSLLAKASLQSGKVEIKCSKCGTLNTFEAAEDNNKAESHSSRYDVTVQTSSIT